MPEISTDYYFDNNATTRLTTTVKNSMIKLLSTPYGNPSSPHSFAEHSRCVIESARDEVSKFLHCESNSIIFNSGASEGNSTVLQSLLSYSGKKVLITTATEHASVSQNAEYLASQGVKTVIIPVDSNGIIDTKKYENALKETGAKLVSFGLVNGETGVLQDIERLAIIAKEQGSWFHTDASQAVGRIKIDLSTAKIDLLTFTGHKLHAPQGVGVMFARNKDFVRPLLYGGEQELNLRAGTENILHIYALETALSERKENWLELTKKLSVLRNQFETEVLNKIPDVIVNGADVERVPNTSNIMFQGVDGQALLAQLDQKGIYCSQTSACTSMIPESSKTLRAMGLSVDDAYSSLRFSFAVDNTKDEVSEAVSILSEVVSHLRMYNTGRDL